MGKKKNKKPLTTAFVRELSRPSPLEEYEQNLFKGRHYLDNLLRLKALPDDEIPETELTYTGARYYTLVLLAHLPHQRVEADTIFQGWLGAFLTRVYDANTCSLESIEGGVQELVLVLVNAVIEQIRELGQTGRIKIQDGFLDAPGKQEQLIQVLFASVMSRAQQHLLYLSWARQHRPVYMFSPTLAEMLTYTKLDNLQVDLLRLPYSTTELAFPKGLFPPYPLFTVFENWQPEQVTASSYGELTGALLVEERGDESGRPRIRVTVLGKNSGNEFTTMCTYFLYTDTSNTLEQELEDSIEKRVTKDTEFAEETRRRLRAHAPGITYFIAASIIYATMPTADAVLGANSPEYAAWAQEQAARKMTRHQVADVQAIRERVERSTRYYLGRSVRIVDRHTPQETAVDGTSTRASPRMHRRAGHFSRYWTGPKDQPQVPVVKYIEPVWVNVPEGSPLPDTTKAGMR